MLCTGSHRYHRQSPQNTAAELGDRRKEDERGERAEEEDAVEAQGPWSRCHVLTENVQTLCFLQFLAVFEPVQSKSPKGRPARIALVFYQRKARHVSGVFCDILRLFDGYCWKRARI